MQLPQEPKITPLYSVLEENLEELEDGGFIRIRRGPDSDSIIGIEVIPLVTIEASSSTSTGTSSWDKQGEALLEAFCNINEELYVFAVGCCLMLRFCGNPNIVIFGLTSH